MEQQKTKEIMRDWERRLNNEAFQKGELRDMTRDQWLKDQIQNSNYLNKLNQIYKNRRKIQEMRKKESQERSSDRKIMQTTGCSNSVLEQYEPTFDEPQNSKRMDKIGLRSESLKKVHREREIKNQNLNVALIRSQAQMKKSMKENEDLEKQVAIQNQLNNFKNMDLQREAHLKRISMLNDNIISENRKGSMKEIHTSA